MTNESSLILFFFIGGGVDLYERFVSVEMNMYSLTQHALADPLAGAKLFQEFTKLILVRIAHQITFTHKANDRTT